MILLLTSHTLLKHDHQVAVAALHILMKKAYKMYYNSVSAPMSLFMWRKEMEEESPQFRFWSITIKFQLSVFTFVQSIRERNFDIYKATFTELIP